MPVLGLNSILNELYYKLAIAYPELVFLATATELYTLLSPSLPPQLPPQLPPSLEFFGKNRIDHNSAIS